MKAQYSGKQAKQYAHFADKSFSWEFIEKPSTINHLKSYVNNKVRVLDLGCGTGRSTQMLLELGAIEKNVIGIDASSDMIKIAKQLIPRATFFQSDLSEFQPQNASFDLIFSNMVLHYVDKKTLFVLAKKIHAWLKRDGIIFFIVTHPLRFLDHHATYFRDKREAEHTPWNTRISYYPKTISDYIEALLQAKFEILSVEEPHPSKLSKRMNPKEYERYAHAPTRLLIKAKK